MNRPRLILLGIDGMDFDFTWSILHKLPNIKRLLKTGLLKPFKSVFPPDSIPSWITCYTGKDPSEHGVLESVNYLGKGNIQTNVDTSTFKGKTFWDIVGQAGLKVCVINPFMAYPVWPVNGVMVNGPVFITGDVQISNPKIIEDIQIPKGLGGMTDFPKKSELLGFCQKIFKETKEQAEFGLELLRKYQPDLFFQVFLTMDRIQHFLWRYCDKDDITYPGPNELENEIEDFYVYMDTVIGKFLEAMEPRDRLVVISDHGHGRRCTHCFNINEYFRNLGYVKSKADGKVLSLRFIIEKMKNRFLNFMNGHDLEDYISVVATFIPNSKNLKKGKHITDNSLNKAYASDFTGTNPFGGICINRDLVQEYEMFRSKLINDLAELTHEGYPVFEWLKRREEMFSGAFLNRYPDILFSLKEKFGVNWSLHTEVFTVNPTHKKISGGHKEYGIFLSNIPSNKFSIEENIEMHNLFPTVLDFFRLDWKEYCSGASFLVNGNEGTPG